MKKDINLKYGNKIIISIEPGYCTNEINISKGYLNDGKLIKSISLSIWDDMAFHGYIDEDTISNTLELDNLKFEFSLDDPIYFCLNRLLGNNKKIIVDDDDTRESMKKYMTIKKEEKNIEIIFTNTKIDYKLYNKYGCFIKNIGPDGRSKIEDFNIKKRLVMFFRDCEVNLLEEVHQITFDECLERARLESLEESPPATNFVKKKVKSIR